MKICGYTKFNPYTINIGAIEVFLHSMVLCYLFFPCANTTLYNLWWPRSTNAIMMFSVSASRQVLACSGLF